MRNDDEDNNNNSIKFIYLRANLTAQKPITKRAREERRAHIQKTK
jgi:hypothetical protein